MKKRTTENIQPEQKLNNEQQMIAPTSRQTIANTLVVGSLFSQRELKFRTWDNVDYMSSHFTIDDVQNKKIQFTGDCPIMQFTGLFDKSGKEIYEGDIVEQEKWVSVGKYEKAIGIIKCKMCEFVVECIGEWSGSNATLNGNAIVLGNVFQNPELLG